MALDFSDPAQRTAFWTLHSDLPREGPGDCASVDRALALARPLPPSPAVLDIGCGPGGQTIDLAELVPDARIAALDHHDPFLCELERRAAERGLTDCISTVHGDMARLPFAPGSFDLIWCEGAAYIVSLDAALTAWRPLLRSGGVLALTEPVWLTDDPPPRVRGCWAECEAMGTSETVRAKALAHGFRIKGDFVLSPEAWWTNYYTPMEARIARLGRDASDAATRIVLDEAREEIECYRRHADAYGYLFIVLTT
jgi:SAM-dependent methyltransferase